MSRTLTAVQLCERSLRMMGAFPITETAADAEDLRESLFWLDLVLSTTSASLPLLFQNTDPLFVTLQAGVQDYVLSSELGSSLPDNGLQFPKEVWLEDDSGNRMDFELVGYEEFHKQEDSAQEGDPIIGYIDRTTTPTLKIWPIWPTGSTETMKVGMIWATFSPDVTPAGVTGTAPNAAQEHQFRNSWQMYLIYRLAQHISSGPVRMLPQSRIKLFEDQADKVFDELDGYSNREHTTEEPVAEPWGYDY